MRLANKQKQCLLRMGIPLWEIRGEQKKESAEKDLAIGVQQSERKIITNEQAGENNANLEDDSRWSQLERQVELCQKCQLYRTRTKTVFGVGNKQAHWLFIGEAPGADEDRQGEPFVGPAGQLLTAMIRALNLTRSEVYIANILKCRPPRNRDPLAAEVETCEPYLQLQLDLIRPKIIVALGRIAAQNLLKKDERIGVMRGRRFYYGPLEIPVVVTYHPAYLLRSPKEKRKVWQDLCLAASIIETTETS